MNIQSVIGGQFSWSRLHHRAVEERSRNFNARCLQVVHEATSYVSKLANAGEEVQTGASIHIWLSFAEFVAWNRSNTAASFNFDE